MVGSALRQWFRNGLPIFVLTVLLLPLVALWLPFEERLPSSGLSPAVPLGRLVVSILVAAAGAAVAVLVGSALAWLFALTDFPSPAVWATVCLLPFVAPPAVWALGQVYCYGSAGFLETIFGDRGRPLLAALDRGRYLSCVLVLAQIHAPLAMLILARALRRVHQSGWEAARFYLPARQRWIWLAGAVRGELLASFLLAFALGLGNFAVAHVLQCRLYVVDVYVQMTNYLDPAGSVRAAGPLLLTTLAAVLLISLGAGVGSGVSARSPQAVCVRLGRSRWICAALLTVYLTLTTFLPLLALVMQCRSPSDFVRSLHDAAPELENTLIIAFSAALVACLAGLTVGPWVARRPHFFRQSLAILPIAVPGLIVGLAFARFANRGGPLDLTWLGSGSLLVVLGLGFRGWPFATRAILHGRQRWARQWDEAAQIGRLSAWRKQLWITAPLMVEHVAAGAVIAFVLAAGDVEISQMLCAPGQGTLALRLFTFLHFGPTHIAANLSLLQLIVAVVPLLMYHFAFNRSLPIV